jgi:hypothetical protein
MRVVMIHYELGLKTKHDTEILKQSELICVILAYSGSPRFNRAFKTGYNEVLNFSRAGIAQSVHRLWVGRLRNRGSIAGRGKDFCTAPTSALNTTNLISNGYRGLLVTRGSAVD